MKGRKTRKDDQYLVLCVAVLATFIASSFLLAIPGASGNYGTATVNGILDDGYTMIYNASHHNADFSVYQKNTGSFYYFYLEANTAKIDGNTTISNYTFNTFTMSFPGMSLNITGNIQFPGLFAFAYSAGRDALEMTFYRYFISTELTFVANGIEYSFSITAFEPPPLPEKQVSLTDITTWITNLLFNMGPISVLLWVFIIIWFWRSLQRKYWLLRKPNSLKLHTFGRWIKEEECELGGIRLWRHTFKTDALKTARVQEIYSHHCKDEIIAKAQSSLVAGYWSIMPYLRVGRLQLMPSQYFTKKVLARTFKAWAKRIFYYLVCMIPKINDWAYSRLIWAETDAIVKDIPYLFITYAEDRVVEVYPCTWQEKRFNTEQKCEEIITENRQLIKEEIALLETQPSLICDSLVRGDAEFVIRPYKDLDEALGDKFSREELMAKHRYEENVLNVKLDDMSERLDGTISVLQNERRDRVKEKHELLQSIDQHTVALRQSFAHGVGKAVGLKSLGVPEQKAIQNVLSETLENYLKNTDEIRKKAELDKEAEIKTLKEKNRQLEIENKKRNPGNIDISEFTVADAGGAT